MQTLEQALVAQGLVTPAQIAEARQLERELRGGLGLNLVRLRYMKEEEIVEACRRAVPGIGVADQALLARASSFALGLLPTPLIERYRAVPVALQGAQLTVAMADPLDAEAIAAIERHTRCKVTPLATPESVVSWALLRYFNILTPSYAGGAGTGLTAATVSLAPGEADVDSAIPLLRRRRAPVGDSPEDLSQVPVDLTVGRRKSQPPAAGELAKIEAALARLERQTKRTVPAVGAGDVPPAVQEATVVATPPTSRPVPAEAAVAGAQLPPARVLATLPPAATAEADAESRVTPLRRSAPVATPAETPAPRPVPFMPPPIPQAAPPRTGTAFQYRAPAAARPLPDVPAPQAAPAAAPAVSPPPRQPGPAIPPPAGTAGAARSVATTLPIGTAATKPGPAVPPPAPAATTRQPGPAIPPPAPAATTRQPGPAIPPPAPAALAPARAPSQPPGEAGRPRVSTPRLVVSRPFSPSSPGLPGLLPVSEQAVQRLRERIAKLEDRDAVTASALFALEELVGPAAFVTRHEAVLRVHRAGKHWKALYGDGGELRPGAFEALDRSLADGEARVLDVAALPLRPQGGRTPPPQLVLVPVLLGGRVAGVFVVLTEKAPEVVRGELARYRVVAAAVSDRLLAILRKKKTVQTTG